MPKWKFSTLVLSSGPVSVQVEDRFCHVSVRITMYSVRHGQWPSGSSHVDGFVQSKCLTIFILKRFLLLGLAQCFSSRAPPSPAGSKWAKCQTPLPQSPDPTAKAEAGWPIAGGDSPAIQTLFKGLGTGPFPPPAETFLFGLDLDWSDTRQPTSRVFFIIGQSACWACEKKKKGHNHQPIKGRKKDFARVGSAGPHRAAHLRPRHNPPNLDWGPAS